MEILNKTISKPSRDIHISLVKRNRVLQWEVKVCQKIEKWRWETEDEFFKWYELCKLYKFCKKDLRLNPVVETLYTLYSPQGPERYGRIAKIREGTPLKRDVSIFYDEKTDFSKLDIKYFLDAIDIVKSELLVMINMWESLTIKGRNSMTYSFTFVDNSEINKGRAKEIMKIINNIFITAGAEIR